MRPGPRLPHMPALDGLRGLAVLGVIAFHAGHLTGGYLGVDAFFVLSGFLITSLLLHERQAQGHINLAHFWERRARRLLPALLTTLFAVTLFAAVFVDSAAERARIRGDVLATLFYVANWRAIGSNQSYWAIFGDPSPLQHTWSLGIEEQFYLLWPLVAFLVLVVARRSARGLLLTAGVGAALSIGLLLAQYTPGTDPSRVYFGTDTRIASICYGAALAAAVTAYGHPRSRGWRVALELVALAGTAWLVFAWTTIDGQGTFLYRGGLMLCGLAVTAVIAACVNPKPAILARALSFAPLRWVGLISYGLYLWHWPVFVFLSPERTGLADSGTLLLLRLVVTAAIAVASYFLLEKPIRQGALRGRPGIAATVAAVASTAVLAVVVLPSGARSGSADLAAALRATPTPAATGSIPPHGEDGPMNSAGAETVDPIAAASASLGRPPRVLIVGDSVGFTVAAGLVPVSDQLGIEVRSKAVIACGVARGSGRVRLPDGSVAVESKACHDWPTTWRAELDQFRPDVVLLIVGWPGSTDRDFDGEWRSPCQPVFDEWYEGEVREALAVLTSTGVAVAMTNAAYWRSPRAPSGNDAKVDCINRIYAEVADSTPGVTLIDLMNYVCPERPVCLNEKDGIAPLRDDGLHFNGPAGTLVGTWILRQALAATPLADPQ
ncbi:MAG: acyltransferase [Acidimicrobiales bacterium]|nr:acyltransferase [Acidimicrobiales bacterium]